MDQQGVRRQRHDVLFQDESLHRALNRSVDMLDLGNVRIPRTPTVTDEVMIDEEDNEDNFMDASIVDKGLGVDVYLAQKNRTEAQDKDINETEKEQKRSGMKKQWSKLLRTTSMKVQTGRKARTSLQETTPRTSLSLAA